MFLRMRRAARVRVGQQIRQVVWNQILQSLVGQAKDWRVLRREWNNIGFKVFKGSSVAVWRIDDGKGTSEATVVRKERRWRGCSCVSARYLLHRALAWRSGGGQNLVLAPLSGNVLVTGLWRPGGRALFWDWCSGLCGSAAAQGDQCHEHGLEEKLMDSGHMLKVEWTGPLDGLETGVREREESKVTPVFFFFFIWLWGYWCCLQRMEKILF